MKCTIQLDSGKEYTITTNGWAELARRVAMLNHATVINSSVTFSNPGLDVVEIQYKFRKGDKEKRAIAYARILKMLEE